MNETNHVLGIGICKLKLMTCTKNCRKRVGIEKKNWEENPQGTKMILHTTLLWLLPV